MRHWERDGITIYNGDCRDVLPRISGADLLLTDPPYGVNYKSGWSSESNIPGDDGSLCIKDCIRQSVLALGIAKHAYVFGQFDLSGLKISKPVGLVWDKITMSGGDLSSPWGKQHENIMFFTNATRATRNRNKEGLSAKMRRGSVIRCQRRNGRKGYHPTEKPVLLLRQLIESSSRIGDLVIDPFCGSSSTLIAAHREGRRAIGIEISDEWYEKSIDRLENEMSSGRTDA